MRFAHYLKVLDLKSTRISPRSIISPVEKAFSLFLEVSFVKKTNLPLEIITYACILNK